MDFQQRPPGEGSVPFIFLPSDSALPATTNAQKLGGSDTSKLSPPSFEMAPLKPKKRKSDDDINRGTWTKRNKEEKPTPQVLCDETKPELDSGEDNPNVAASFSSAMADYQKRLQPLLPGNSPGYNGFSDDSSGPSSPAIADVDKISVDSKDMGVDDSTVAELLKQLKVRPNIRLPHVVMGDENTEQLALKEVIDAVFLWKNYLSTVNNQQASGYFDGKTFTSFNKLDQSICTLIRKKGMPDCMRTELRKLHKMCQDASSKHLSEGRYDHDGTSEQIATIEGLAKLLTYDHNMERDAAGLEAGATAPPNGRPRITIRTGNLTAFTRIPSKVYSGRSLTILHNLWDAGLCAGTEDKDMQNALKNVYDKIPLEHYELLCHGAWQFEANRMRPLSPQWVKFCRFAFRRGERREERERYVFAELARLNGKKTAEEITADWQHMFVAISDSLKFQLQEMNYNLCPCNISHPHSATALQKSLQFLQDAENNTEERIKQAVSACTALAFFDSVIEEGSEISKHTDKNSYKAIRTAMEGFKGDEGLSDETKYDLSNVIAYLDAAEAEHPDVINSKSERERRS